MTFDGRVCSYQGASLSAGEVVLDTVNRTDTPFVYVAGRLNSSHTVADLKRYAQTLEGTPEPPKWFTVDAEGMTPQHNRVHLGRRTCPRARLAGREFPVRHRGPDARGARRQRAGLRVALIGRGRGRRATSAGALHMEVSAGIDAHAEEVDENSHRLVVRHDHHNEREVITAAGPVPVRRRGSTTSAPRSGHLDYSSSAPR